MSKVKLIPGLFALMRMANTRKERIEQAEATYCPDPIGEVAKQMHPDFLSLMVHRVAEENDSVRTYRLVCAGDGISLPVFQAGQYISVKLSIGQTQTSRAYTISSAPYEAEGENGYYEITVRKKPGGCVSGYLFDNWKAGTKVYATGPHGDFYYCPLRDHKDIVALAGGAGITPFRSMMKQLAVKEKELTLTLLYGCKDGTDVLFEKELDALIEKESGRFRRVNTYETAPQGECQGYLDAKFINENIQNPQNKTFFICGPAIMYEFLRDEFSKVGNLRRKQLRFEVGGAPDDVTKRKDWPKEAKAKAVQLTVHIGNLSYDIPAGTTESILASIERAGLLLDSCCRSGECGICRSKLNNGDVFIIPDNDGRRVVDKQLGYIHPCSTYPLSDCSVTIPPPNSVKNT
jgi:ferredoxin-NADP reductase